MDQTEVKVKSRLYLGMSILEIIMIAMYGYRMTTYVLRQNMETSKTMLQGHRQLLSSCKI